MATIAHPSGHADAELPSAASIGPLRRAILFGVLLIASLAYNYNFILIDYVRPFLTRDGGMTLAQTAWFYTAQASGVLIASFLSPVLVSRMGSRPVLLLSLALLSVLTLMNELVITFPAWLITRFVVGLALTSTYTASITMLANFVPPQLRGRLLGINMGMFSLAMLSIGGLGALVGMEGWRTLIRVGAGAPFVALLLALWLPDDRRYRVYGNSDATDQAPERGSWREMLSGRYLKLTLICLFLAGINFSGYQFYSGFFTTYLLNVRGFSAEVTGLFVIMDGLGGLIGAVLWGWLADRYGRRVLAFSFALAAVLTLAFLVAPVSTPVLMLLELGYAIALTANVVWACYFAELFPVRLRPMGTSLFHGGHLVSLFAPLIVTWVAANSSLAVGMALAPATFLMGAILWAFLPETLKTGLLYRGYSPDRP
jgi:predicted MFS family arabinose efflux permease